MALSAGTTAFAANEWQSVSANNESPKWTNPVKGQHQYGKVTVSFTNGSGGVAGEIYEDCGSGYTYKDVVAISITEGITQKSLMYYMSGACSYKVKLIVGSSGGTAYIRNWY
ncbi:hypothetical protein ACVNS2_19355 [Paenibacillus caseinilyticus]|uniref:hypothetical protein n=1 Tax=Paenibacillus mucilaginosus TaxID=61624 RepID=UPI0019D3A482|nr:hypothetical protein [Paenibacillus mucilaginosus]